MANPLQPGDVELLTRALAIARAITGDSPPQAAQWPAKMDRETASDYLKQVHGVQAARATLARMASVGGGPVYSLCGRRPVYDRADLDSWARSKLTPPAGSSSEHGGRS